MFQNILNRVRRVEAPSLCAAEELLHDPLSHPEIRRMSPIELADLPFDQEWAKEPEERCGAA